KTSVTVSPAQPSRVWALVEAPEPKGGLYRSDDHGKTWTQVNDNRQHLQRAWYYTHIYAHPTDPNTVYSLNTRFYKSTDGGETFDSYGVPHGDEHDLWINPEDPDRMVLGNDGGAQVTVDGAETWSTYMNQPTAEMYSVTVDDEFPYRVYGPQQDNSTIRLPSWSGGSIHPKSNWTDVGGCETGPVALHPDRPWLVYSGCYGGHLSRVNMRTEQSRNVMVYPQLQLGQAPRTLRERFQWNAPIEVSPHNPDVVYHASHRIWRSTDRGMSWTRVSGDLTTDTKAHQDFAGEPITKDNTGVEVFNTVFSLQVSPHSAKTLWAGTDDGRVWISRNRAGNWKEITPDALPQYGTVQRIEVSPHDPGTAYVTVHRYRLDDWRPYVFRTTDYGDSWTRIADGTRGIPKDSPTWVVREDPKREGLLYAGTEFGVYVSFNDGQDWQSLQQNLPITRVPDLKVKDSDLVVATHGRSFWILDDLGPLRQLTDRVADADMHLYSPPAAYLVNSGSGNADHEDREPAGDPGGATLDYAFAETPDTTVTLDVLGPDGAVVRRFTSDSAAAKKNKEPVLPAEAGLNRFHWSLRGKGINTVDDAILWGYTGGPKVVPGTYTARLATASGDTLRQSFEVRMDPRLKDVTKADLQAQYDLATAIRDTTNAIYDAIRTIRSVREQVTSVAEHAAKAGHDGLTARADSIAEQLTSIEQELMQTKNESHQDPLNFPPQLDNQYAYLYGFVVGPNGPPTKSAKQRFRDLNQEEWAPLRRRLHTVLNTDLPQFNERVRALNSDPVFVPTSGE
ncbi:MAG: WD40/YVTN/BNR-like repeat-containing protein, partial [Salinibacter sp.]